MRVLICLLVQEMGVVSSLMGRHLSVVMDWL